jgi:hypothetical protein
MNKFDNKQRLNLREYISVTVVLMLYVINTYYTILLYNLFELKIKSIYCVTIQFVLVCYLFL